MMDWIKENAIILSGFLLIGCFVTGFSSTFSFLGRSANVIGTIVVLAGIDRLIKHESKLEGKIENLERANRTLSNKLASAKEELKYYHEKEAAGEE